MYMPGMMHHGQADAVISTAPTSLESTVAVLSSWGPDLHFNIVKPSQSFDSLASDFKFSLLVGILLLLAVAVFVLRRQVMKKKLNASWT
jgi:ER membrane protein complex subunit 1, C-terminal